MSAPDISADRSVAPEAARERDRGPPKREVIYRHTVLVRIGHWINAAAIFLLIGTGLNIFNAHPRLYWGRYGANADPALLSIGAQAGANGAPQGVLQIGSLHFVTTGVLGWSQSQGRGTERAWPSWLTIPSFTDLADARHWHFFLAWVLAINGLIYLVWSLVSRHAQRDLWPTMADLRRIPRETWNHLRLKYPKGEEAKRYGVLQRLAYLGLIVLVIGMVCTGLTMSPGIDAAAPWLTALYGGRQSARTIHFICASLIALFIVVHLVQVVLAGPINETWSMISGRYRVPREHD